MTPSRPSASYDHGGVDVAPVMIPRGPIYGQPCLYSYPSHVHGHFDRTVSYEENSNNETRLKAVAPFESQISSKAMESNTSYLPQRRFDTTTPTPTVYPQNHESESDILASSRSSDPKNVQAPYFQSNGNQSDCMVDRSRVPILANSWKNAPIPGPVGSFDRFKEGNFERYTNDAKGNLIDDHTHFDVTQGIFPAKSRDCQPPYHYINLSSTVYKFPAESQRPYLNQPISTTDPTANKITEKGSSSATTEQLDVHQPLIGSHVNQALIYAKGPMAIDTAASKEGTVMCENRGEMATVQVATNKIDFAKTLREIASDEPFIWGCTCKKSKCLKLYCQCFGSASKCGNMCRCVSCFNNKEYEQLRKSAVRAVLARNPNAFDKKIGVKPANNEPAKILTFICKCRKSACLKKYCECFNADRECHSACRCIDCQNRPPSDEPIKVKPEKFVSPMTVTETSIRNERMMDAVQNLALLKNNPAPETTETERSSASLPSLTTIHTAVVSKDDDDSTIGTNKISSNSNGGYMQGMDILALAALTELKSLSRDDHSMAKMMRTSSLSTCSSSFDESQSQPIYDGSKLTTESNDSNVDHDGFPLKKRSCHESCSSEGEHHAEFEAAISLDMKKRKEC